MKAEQWVKETLSSKIINEQIMLTENIGVDIEIFITFFGASIEDDKKKDKHQALLGEQTFVWFDETVTRTGVELGYKDYFDAWHAEDLI